MPEQTKQQQRERVRQRIRAAVDPEHYEYTPEKHQSDHVKADEFQRVAIYARVSTNDPTQTSSFELQQKYYQELVGRYPKWELVRIYADEGKSGTTIQHRTGFLEMMNDAFAGRIDLIIVKNISRLARNVVDFLSTIRKLSERKVGVLFESEAIYSLNTNSHLALSFQATIAEEESRVRSRSMESSLRMRLDHGLPLTPELLGFIHDENGKLIINPKTYKIPKLMFYMYLYGYSTNQIAEILIKLSKRSYRGNIKWSASSVAKTLQNERYCGDVRTRKRFKLFAADVTNQKTFKNRGEKPQSYYKNEHDAIISRDDFLAVQRIMNNAKYGGTSLLPSLQVIPEGLLKGFVIIHPKWGSFRMDDYIQASKSVDPLDEDLKEEMTMEAHRGEFDLRGYEVADFKLFDDHQVPSVLLQKSEIRFNIPCIRRMNCGNQVELLVHPLKKQIAVRPAMKDERCAIQWAGGSGRMQEARMVACRAFIDTIFEIFGWKDDYKYKLYGCIYHDGKENACIFSDLSASVFINREDYLSTAGVDATGQLLNASGKRVRAVSGNLGYSFGNEYYVERSLNELRHMSSQEWKTRIEGQICSTGPKLNITSYETLRAFIKEELGDLFEEQEEETT